MRAVTRPVRLPVARRYADVLGEPGARAFFLAAVPARIGTAMISLGLIWLVRWGTGSYTDAGLVAGAFAVTSACTAPVFGRLTARFGQARVLVPCASGLVCATAALVACCATHYPLWSIVLLGITAGALRPQIAALTATRWSFLLAGRPGLSAAFALESLSNELSYLFGPALVSTVSAVVIAPAGVALAVVLVLGGSVGLAAQRATEPTRAEAARPAEPVGGRFLVLCLVSFGIGSFFGAMQVSVTAFATEHGVAGSAGLIYSLLSVTSLLAGFGYGARHWRIPVPRQLVIALLVTVVCCVPLLLAHSTATLAVALLFPGFGLAPSIIVLSLSAERLVAQAALARAFALLTSASAVGTAIAAALAGRAIDQHGAGWGFGIAAGSMVVAELAGLLALGTQQRQ